MRAFSRCLFDEIVSGTTPVVSMPEHDELMGSVERLSLHAVAQTIAVGATPWLNVQLDHTADGLTYAAVTPGAPEINRAVLAASGRTDAMGAMSTTSVSLGRVRLSVSLNTGDVARVKVFVTGRTRMSAARAARADGATARKDCGCGGCASIPAQAPRVGTMPRAQASPAGLNGAASRRSVGAASAIALGPGPRPLGTRPPGPPMPEPARPDLTPFDPVLDECGKCIQNCNKQLKIIHGGPGINSCWGNWIGDGCLDIMGEEHQALCDKTYAEDVAPCIEGQWGPYYTCLEGCAPCPPPGMPDTGHFPQLLDIQFKCTYKHASCLNQCYDKWPDGLDTVDPLEQLKFYYCRQCCNAAKSACERTGRWITKEGGCTKQ